MSLNIHQKIILIFFSLIALLTLYDVIFHVFFAALHLLYELAEWLLDHLIELFFDTGWRETQIIVFYLLFITIALGLYRLLPYCYRRSLCKLQLQKQETVAQWQALPVVNKLMWYCIVLLGSSGWLFLT